MQGAVDALRSSNQTCFSVKTRFYESDIITQKNGFVVPNNAFKSCTFIAW